MTHETVFRNGIIASGSGASVKGDIRITSGAFYGNGQGLTDVPSASYSTTASYALNVTAPTWETITGKPEGLVSSSAQLASDISGAFEEVSSSLASRVATNESDISTIQTEQTTQDGRLDSLEQVTGSYATTGSNHFIGNQTIDGDILVRGTATIEELIISNSIYHVTQSKFSGSTIFGDTLDDTHQFTGSILVTGSQEITGGDLTINGTNVSASIADLYANGPDSSSYAATSSWALKVVDPTIAYKDRYNLFEFDAGPTDGKMMEWYNTDVGSRLYLASDHLGNDLSLVASGSGANTKHIIGAVGTDEVHLSADGLKIVVGGAIESSNPITGSFVKATGTGTNLIGTASWAENAISASYIPESLRGIWTASGDYINRESDVKITGSLYVRAEASPAPGYVYANILGGDANNVAEFYHRYQGDGLSGLQIYGHESLGFNTRYTLWLNDNRTFTFRNQTGSFLGYDTANKHEITGSVEITNDLTVNGTLNATSSWANSVKFENVTGKPTLLSGSAQIATEISGAFVAPSASFSTRVTNIENGEVTASWANWAINALTANRVEYNNVTDKPTLVSSSAQIADDISGSFVAPSSSFSSRVTTIEELTVVVTGQTTGVNVVDTFSTGSYFGSEWSYVMRSGSTGRAGKVIAAWDTIGNRTFTEYGTQDIGDTSDLDLTVNISGNDVQLQASSTKTYDYRIIRRPI